MNDEGISFLRLNGMPMSDIQGYLDDGMTLDEIVSAAKYLIEKGEPITNTDPELDAITVPEWRTSTNGQIRVARPAASFGEDNTSFLWYPYLPIGDYSVLMADGGTGKTILCCGIAAAVSSGKPLPGDEFDCKGRRVLIISAEDRGELLKKRLKLSGANLEEIFILDCSDSIGMNFSEGYEEFAATILNYKPSLLIIDPWHAFLGANVDINRTNAVRPVFQRLANLAKNCDCAMILVSHVNKRSQADNANNAATGSADFINAARSAMRVVFDEDDEDCRILVHTKTNYAAAGKSVRYRINDGGLEWAGFSEITRQTLEEAARKRSTPWEVLRGDRETETSNAALIAALEASANQFAPTRFSYDEFKEMHGELIFGGRQPKRAIESVRDILTEEGYFLNACAVKKGGKTVRGFLIQRIENTESQNVG